MPTIEQIKQLRAETGAGIADVKEALVSTAGDVEAAKKYLAKKGMAKAEKRSEREAKEGIISSYIHNTNKVAVLVEVNCETDFVAKSDDFVQFGRDVALQVAALSPLYVSKEDVPASVAEEFKNEVNADPKFSGKPDAVKQTIIDSKLKTYAEEFCLLEQKFFKDGAISIDEMLKAISSKVGEAVKIKRFVRYAVGE
jgi:elongation factor Ts